METDKNNNTSYKNEAPSTVPTLTAPDLWDRIQAHHATLAADMALVGRLRAEGALREPDPRPILLEYLRFAYLAWTHPEGATPSKAVDEVWHTHILFTRSYARFCAETKGDLLHHDPGGGEEDKARFDRAYRRTIARYEAEFGPPPGGYWPRPAEPPPQEVPKPEPPKAVPRHPPSSNELPLVIGILGSIAAFLVTASLFGAFYASVTGAILGIAIILGANASTTAPPPRAARPPQRPAPRRNGGRNTGSTDSGSGGTEAAVLGGGGDCSPGSHGGCADGGGSASSCSSGSSCGGGGGCGGG